MVIASYYRNQESKTQPSQHMKTLKRFFGSIWAYVALALFCASTGIALTGCNQEAERKKQTEAKARAEEARVANIMITENKSEEQALAIMAHQDEMVADRERTALLKKVKAYAPFEGANRVYYFPFVGEEFRTELAQFSKIKSGKEKIVSCAGDSAGESNPGSNGTVSRHNGYEVVTEVIGQPQAEQAKP
jgi:hypothetical protein